MRWTRLPLVFALFVLSVCSFATPELVEHVATNQVFGETGGITMREPDVPREDEAITVWAKIGYSFFYTDVAIYYTTDGSTPSGSLGVPGGTTQVLRSSASQVTFVRNQASVGGTLDWWRATLPASTRTYGQTVKYKVSAWHSSGGAEVFSNNYGCSDGVCDDPGAPASVHLFTNKLAWPGRGAAYVDHANGYPPVTFWKEEAVVGNNYANIQLDQNGTVFDFYYPSAGLVQGMGTKNEGYVDGLDTFPPGLPPGNRGQMNVNQLMGGIRVDGKTYWLSNENGSGYTNVTQAYVANSNTVATSATLTAAGNNIQVQQTDFSPKGITFPNDQGGNPNRGLYVKRMLLTNNGVSAKTVNVYYYGDFALNGGDSYDVMYTDPGRGAMVAYDNVPRFTSSSGEYNPSSFSNYDKSVSIFMAAAMKLCGSVGGSSGTPATDFWRDTSTDNNQGWLGLKVTLNPGQTREVDVLVAGGFDNFPNATGTYNYQVAPAIDWFANTSMQTMLTQTDAYWQNWLDAGTTVDTPEQRYDDLFTRSLLATALHLDGKGGGLIAGMHNGAYPCIWPRDAVYGAISLARTGHFPESAEVYRFLREVAYRGNESWGKGFWYQKYTTDGYIVWNSPQVDETAVVPWGVLYHYRATGDNAFLNTNGAMSREAAFASSSDSVIDSRLYYADAFDLMYSNNVWEDSWDTFLYSNANVERGLRDAATIATLLGNPGDAATFTSRANAIHNGMIARLDWDGENTDISQLGLVYPFQVFSPTDPKMAHLADRMNGVGTDRYGNNHPIVNFSGEFQNLINRYWGDSYWNGGPWFLSTLWYGLYYAERADYTSGKSDIDNHKSRIDVLFPHLGPAGFGAEQIAPSNSLLYPGQTDFRLQAAWPNAWESMSTYLDAVMAFADFEPDAPANTIKLAPKLPTGWSTMTFKNLRVGSHRVDATATESSSDVKVTFKNLTGNAVSTQCWLKLPVGTVPSGVVTVNGQKSLFTYDQVAKRVRVIAALATGVNATTAIRVVVKRPVSPP